MLFLLPVLLPEEIVNARFSSLSCVERAQPLIDFSAQGTQLLGMRDQRTVNLILGFERTASLANFLNLRLRRHLPIQPIAK